MRSSALRSTALVTLAMSLLAAPGCSPRIPVGEVLIYAHDRGMDALDVLDLGITVSPRLSLSAYVSLLGLGVGAGAVDGYFAGIGGSRVGIFRHYHSSIGLVLYAYEMTGWGDFDVNDRNTLAVRHRGPIAWIFIPSSSQCKGAGRNGRGAYGGGPRAKAGFS